MQLRRVKALGSRFASMARARLPAAQNEPMLDYAPGSAERLALRHELQRQVSQVIDIPCIVNGREVYTGNTTNVTMPTRHGHMLARVHKADAALVEEAADAAVAAQEEWMHMPTEHRLGIFLKAADLLSKRDRAKVCAATMLGQGKNPWQAEIDAAAELCDFWRYGAHFAQEIYDMQPYAHAAGTWNRLEHRPLEGFVLAISPFNFTAIGGNLPSAPVMLGNTALWKPATTAALSNYYVMELLQEAGLPAGVINFIPGHGGDVGNAFDHPHFAGLHFTGSTATFQHMWKLVADNTAKGVYKAYPRMVGETGGKNFHFAHESADMDNLVNQTIRGAFEFNGQKCSATSRMYVPASLWEDGLRDRLVQGVAELKQGCVTEFDNFATAVIDRAAFDKIKGYIDMAKSDPGCKILVGGDCDDSEGYFVQPTVVQVHDRQHPLMTQEIFGPVLTVCVHEDDQWQQALQHCASDNDYALTGAVFANDREAIQHMDKVLCQAAGNFYINDKSTGAVVGQQPFGGARASGTNDKAGSVQNMLRWVSTRTVKENFVPLRDYAYPHMRQDAHEAPITFRIE